MEINLNKLNEQKIRKAGNAKTVKMGFSEDAKGIIFNMFTETIYQNPIGSIVREITSNCFDSHVEAGTESPQNPVIIKKTYDKVADQHYLSFFDKGVGMSPDRVENIYGQYFESTKRSGNEQIGGFGIGGKTPLAYTESFFVVTRYNGMEYSYSIFKGEETPEISLLHECSTKEVNGTEVRIPIKRNDISQFQREIIRQLYYFENIVFQGFDNDEELNNYRVYKGEHFLYRGSGYEDAVHVCLGKVAYKLSYNELGLSEWDFRIPIGLKFDIGDIKVTANRENLQYSPETVKTILAKIESAKEEIRAMISKEYGNVRTLEDYYRVQEDFGYLKFQDQNTLNVSKWVTKKNIDFANFKYNDLPSIPSTENVIKFFYNVHEYGKRGGYNAGISVRLGEPNDRVYYCRGEFARKIIKQSYLNHEHDKNFVILKPYGDKAFEDDSKLFEKMRLAFGVDKDQSDRFSTPDIVNVMPVKKALPLLKALAKDIAKIVAITFENYDDLDVPQDFIDARKQERLSKEILNTTIPVKGAGYGSRSRIKIENIMNFRGRIYWGVTDEIDKVREGRDLFKALFGKEHITDVWGYKGQFSAKKGIVFINVSQANAKYMRMCDTAYHIDTLYPTMLRRKMINPANIKAAVDFLKKFEDVPSLYKNKNLDVVNKVVHKYYEEVKAEAKELEKYEDYQYMDFDCELVSKYVKFDNLKSDLVIKTDKKLAYLYEVADKNKDIIKWVNLPYYADDVDLKGNNYSGLVELLKKVMVF